MRGSTQWGKGSYLVGVFLTVVLDVGSATRLATMFWSSSSGRAVANVLQWQGQAVRCLPLESLALGSRRGVVEHGGNSLTMLEEVDGIGSTY